MTVIRSSHEHNRAHGQRTNGCYWLVPIVLVSCFIGAYLVLENQSLKVGLEHQDAQHQAQIATMLESSLKQLLQFPLASNNAQEIRAIAQSISAYSFVDHIQIIGQDGQTVLHEFSRDSTHVANTQTLEFNVFDSYVQLFDSTQMPSDKLLGSVIIKMLYPAAATDSGTYILSSLILVMLLGSMCLSLCWLRQSRRLKESM